MRIELGCAGHLIVGNYCHWHRHTQVNGYRISTVGNYYPRYGNKRETIGGGEDFFETMVFKTTRDPEEHSENCGCRKVIDWTELECHRYATAGEAQKGHEKVVRKYMRRNA